MNAIFSKVIIYAKDIQKTSEFYVKYFGFKSIVENGLIVLMSKDGVESILIHQVGKGINMGHACIKLVFTGSDVKKDKTVAAKEDWNLVRSTLVRDNLSQTQKSQITILFVFRVEASRQGVELQYRTIPAII